MGGGVSVCVCVGGQTHSVYVCMYACVFVLLSSDVVRGFLCLDDPPGPFDSLEESKV